ncbi:TonB-dependent receptor plug domain-containing protein [Saccharicrinis sp. GN24d3]|uniref:TonB-dependent receptor plug domain-containing protein n=1 Tax=Saccharicrinis sp. 156 TaxID=3417574 RepID=UPI003D3532CB
MPIPNVIVFDESESIIAGTNDNGLVNISIFEEDAALWFKHPAYELFFLSRKNPLPQAISLCPKVFTLDEFVVSASRTRENKKNIPYFLETIKPRSIEFNNAPTGADILTGSGYVAVQKSQGGGGSPILRGFEANRVLLVMDGVRMNNAIYRSGHLQNSITIDPNILDKTEILFGPSSVMYGSDALGGVVSYFSKDPVLSNDSMAVMAIESSIQSMSASSSNKVNINVNAGFKHWASLTSFTYSDFGNIKMGENRASNVPEDWGKVFHYAKRINGKDSMMVNADPYTQPNTGYQQYDLLQKFKFTPSHKHSLLFNFQYSTTSNINRFDALNDYKDDLLKYAQYYYGPQERLFASVNSRYKKETKLFSSVNTIVAYQNIKESRFSRKFNSDNKLSQEEYLDIYSLNLDLAKEFNPSSKINYGIEILYNDMASHGKYTNIETRELSTATSRYPNGGSFFQAYSAYFNYHTKFNKRFSANFGARFGYFRFNSKFMEDELFKPIVTDLIMSNKAPSASVGLVYIPADTWKFSSVLSSGYRVPNVDDYGKIRAKNDEISMPNPFLKPEYAFNAELSATKSFYNENLLINITLYNTWLHDAIVREYYTYQGSDSIEYDGDTYRMYINSNQQKAIVKGLSAGMHAQPFHNLSVNATINYTHGQVSYTNEPMGHITPVFGKAAVNYRHKEFRVEFYMNYQGEKKYEDMSPYGEDNEDEGTEDGFPAWQTYNMAIQYQLFNTLTLQASVENILDRHYKTFASGISAPGRNLILSLTGRF